MPQALIPAIIGLVGSIVGTVGGAMGKGGLQDRRTQGQKDVSDKLEADLLGGGGFDAFNNTLNPLNIAPRQQGAKPGGLAGGSIDFNQAVPLSPTSKGGETLGSLGMKQNGL